MIISGTDLAFARACQESIMTDTGQLRREDPDSDPVYDPETGTTTPAYLTLYEGIGRAQVPNAQGSTPIVVDNPTTVQPYVCAVPWSVTDIRPGDEWVTLTSRDPAAVGRTIVITHVHDSTYVTARRFTGNKVT